MATRRQAVVLCVHVLVRSAVKAKEYAPIRQVKPDVGVDKPEKMHSYGEFPSGGNAKLSLKRQHGVKCKPSMVALTDSLGILMSTTFPRLLATHAAQRPHASAMREKEYGIWQSMEWAAMLQMVTQMACGLHQAGLQRGEHMVVIGANRPRLYATMLAAQALGAIPVPLYQDAVAAECVFPINNAEVRFCVVEDQEQVDKMLEVREQCPQISHIFTTIHVVYVNTMRLGLDLSKSYWLLAKSSPNNIPTFISKKLTKAIRTMWRQCFLPLAPQVTPKVWCIRTTR